MLFVKRVFLHKLEVQHLFITDTDYYGCTTTIKINY